MPMTRVEIPETGFALEVDGDSIEFAFVPNVGPTAGTAIALRVSGAEAVERFRRGLIEFLGALESKD